MWGRLLAVFCFIFLIPYIWAVLSCANARDNDRYVMTAEAERYLVMVLAILQFKFRWNRMKKGCRVPRNEYVNWLWNWLSLSVID